MAYNFENLWKNKGGLGFFFFNKIYLKQMQNCIMPCRMRNQRNNSNFIVGWFWFFFTWIM